MGQVIGSSDKKISVPASEPVSSQDVLATVMHTLFNIGELRVVRGVPTDVNRAITDGRPIEQLV